MSQKKGSLIRRLAEDRREKESETPEPQAQVFSIPLAPAAAEPAPLSIDKPMSLGGPTPMPTPEGPSTPTEFEKSEEPAGKGASVVEAHPTPAPDLSKPVSEIPHRLARIPGRQRGRKTENCTRHPGEAKRTAGARTWLTPEENEKLELLAMAYQVSTSTLTRDILLEGLEAHRDLIEKTRRFMDSLRRTSA